MPNRSRLALIFAIALGALGVAAATSSGAERAAVPPILGDCDLRGGSAGSSPLDHDPELRWQVVGVLDGDTICVRARDLQRQVRLVQSDTPEMGENGEREECYAGRATSTLLSLLQGAGGVRLEGDPNLDDVDSYDRLLRYVITDRNLNLELVRRGAATVFFFPFAARGPFGKLAATFRAAGLEARAAGRGLWGACPRTPWDMFLPATTGYEWTFDDGALGGWQLGPAIGASSIAKDGQSSPVLRVRPVGPDPWISNSELAIPATDTFVTKPPLAVRQYSRLIMRVASSAPDGRAAVSFLGKTETGSFQAGQKVEFKIPNRNGSGRAPFHLLCVLLASDPDWYRLGLIGALRLDLADQAGAPGMPVAIGIDFIRVEKGGCTARGSIPGAIVGRGGADRLSSGSAGDEMLGEAGNDVLAGNGGDDRLVGGPGGDRLLGGSGNDELVGGAGNDVLVGGPGADFISCGGGRDRVVSDARDYVASDCETR